MQGTVRTRTGKEGTNRTRNRHAGSSYNKTQACREQIELEKDIQGIGNRQAGEKS